MEVRVKRGAVHRVEIADGWLDLDISPKRAYTLLLALDEKRSELQELAQNYYDCPNCSETHHKSVTICPNRA